jgi:hypothetical protein
MCRDYIFSVTLIAVGRACDSEQRYCSQHQVSNGSCTPCENQTATLVVSVALTCHLSSNVRLRYRPLIGQKVLS